MPRVSVIVPIFNGVRFLPAFFESLKAALPLNSELILVDDGSSEAVFDLVPEMPGTESLICLRNDTNLGYSVSVNRGFQAATGDVIIQLNSDLLLEPACISTMIDLIQGEPNVGIVGSKLIFPTTGLVQHVGMGFGYHSKRHVYFELPSTHRLCQKTREVQVMTGATVAMTRRVLDRIGPLDEGYFNHNEDLDHCLRALQHGFRNFVCSESVAYHWVSQSGPSRFARLEASEAAFWSRWGGYYDIDLGRFLDEAVDHILDVAPHLETFPFQILNLSRGADDHIVVERLAERWPDVEKRILSFRQMNNPAKRLWLSMLLPHWMVMEPMPFIYLVDKHRELEDNVLWFQNRRSIVADELIVDLTAAVLRTSEFLPG